MSDENKDFDGIKYRVETKSPAVFRILFTVLVLWGICFMGYYLFSGWSSEAEFAQKKLEKQAKLASSQPAEGKTSSASADAGGKKEDSIAVGKKEFVERCAACHGVDAKGGIGPDLTRKEFKYGKTATTIVTSITDGRPGGMPSFKNDLSHEKVEGLVKYILSF